MPDVAKDTAGNSPFRRKGLFSLTGAGRLFIMLAPCRWCEHRD
ncbi:hypothetical protein EPYR_00585 [Erwinia pyrifoliae DSM 12163]|nr:hypothetical protein EJP617_05400 [Erwinia sp. Ejp617]CAY72941.1 hypothetical protein EPYR_00585 [Erwinia pyrifoliae DSM 12163]